MSGSNSLYFFLFSVCEKNPFWCEKKIVGVSSCMISWDTGWAKIIYITVSHRVLSLSQGWASKRYQTIANKKKISQGTKLIQMEKSNLKPQFLYMVCFVIFAMISWTYGSSLERFPFPVSPKQGASTSQASLVQRKQCHRPATEAKLIH